MRKNLLKNEARNNRTASGNRNLNWELRFNQLWMGFHSPQNQVHSLEVFFDFQMPPDTQTATIRNDSFFIMPSLPVDILELDRFDYVYPHLDYTLS